MAQADDSWSTNSNDALVLSLVTPTDAGLNTIASFNPKFTYPVFGDDERIFGYQNLKIALRYNATDMRPNLKVSYGKIFKAVGDVEPADIKEELRKFLPEVAFSKESEYVNSIRAIPETWTPPGSLLTKLEGKDGRYEIWYGNLADPAMKQLVNRIQILASLFIEGGTPIKTQPDEDGEGDSLDRWTVFFLYKKQPVPGQPGRFSYVFAGYSTVYRFFLFQPLSPPTSPKDSPKSDFELPTRQLSFTEFPCRTRISQFVILPPFQGKGNGARLYSTIFSHYLKESQTIEITVEDPNEAFDELRDLSDLAYLRSIPEFKDFRINTEIKTGRTGPVPKNIVDEKALETLRVKNKIAPRQFARVTEMHLMSKLADSVRPGIDPENSKQAVTKEQEHEYKLWKLLVKQRLYKHNRDLLGQLEKDERIEKLEETLRSVELEYARLLAASNSREQKAASAANGKRRLDDGDGDGEQQSVKKVKVADA